MINKRKTHHHFFSRISFACLAAFLFFAHAPFPAHASEKTAGSHQSTEAEPRLLSCRLQGKEQIFIEGIGTDAEFPLYLFELKPDETSLAGRTDFIAQITEDTSFSITLSRLDGNSEDRLYSRFVLTRFEHGTYQPVSNELYITNPEAIATHTEPFAAAQSKKGLLIETKDSSVTDAFDLGVNHVLVNIAFQQLFGSGIDYVYEGKTYHFNKGLISRLDQNIQKMSSKNIVITAVLLNGWNPSAPQLIYPGLSRQPDGTAFYYSFHTATKESADTIRAVASFLAERYGSLSSHGKISNWIIGNEINNQQWNYLGEMDLTSYLKEYERAFRLFYTTIRSINANDRFYFSTDYNWNREADGRTRYTAREVLCEFARLIRESGEIDWGLAYHPYAYPMTEPEFWDDDQTGLVTSEITSPIVNMKNLSVLTDFMQTPSLLNQQNQVRHILLSEQGFTSKSATRGEQEELQAAAIAYAYYLADSNPYIDAFIMNRQVDAPIEADASLELGLWHYDKSKAPDIVADTKKKSWNVYKYINKKGAALEVTRFAKELLGIEKWSEQIPDFRWKNLE